MSKTTIRPMIEVALLATIAYILDLVTQPMSLGPWISLSFKMVPIFLLSFRWGVKAGAMGGIHLGTLASRNRGSSWWLVDSNPRFLRVFCSLQFDWTEWNCQTCP